MIFPKSIGLSINGNDLTISKAYRKHFKYVSDSIVVKDFLLKDTLELKMSVDVQGFHAKEVVLSWPREKTIVREIELPGSRIKELKESISYQLDSFILYSEDEVYYDLYPSISAEYGEKAIIFAIRKTDIDGILSKLEALNINPDRIIISALSFIPFTRNNKLLVLSKCENAYTCNVYANTSLVNTFLIKDKDEVMEKIVNVKPDKVILLDKECEGIVDPDKNNLELWESARESAGAALNGVTEYLSNFNVLKKKRNKILPKYVLAGVLSLLIITFAFIIPGINKYKKAMAMDAIDIKLKEINHDVTIARALKDRIEGLLETSNNLNNFVNFNKRRVDLLFEFTNIIPDDAWIKQLSFKKDYFEIEGVGASGAGILTLLENSPVFSHVKFTSSVIKDREGNERFKIKGDI